MSEAAKNAARKRSTVARNKAQQLARAAQAFPVWPLDWSREDRLEAVRVILESARMRLNARIYVGDSRPTSVSISTTFAIEITEAMQAAEALLR